MTERDMALLEGIDKMIADAPEQGLCAGPFLVLRAEVRRILVEREILEDAMKDIAGVRRGTAS